MENLPFTIIICQRYVFFSSEIQGVLSLIVSGLKTSRKSDWKSMKNQIPGSIAVPKWGRLNLFSKQWEPDFICNFCRWVIKFQTFCMNDWLAFSWLSHSIDLNKVFFFFCYLSNRQPDLLWIEQHILPNKVLLSRYTSS